MKSRVHVSEGRNKPTSDFVALNAPHSSKVSDVINFQQAESDSDISSMSDISEADVEVPKKGKQQGRQRRAMNMQRKRQNRKSKKSALPSLDPSLNNIANPNKFRPMVDPPKEVQEEYGEDEEPEEDEDEDEEDEYEYAGPEYEEEEDTESYAFPPPSQSAFMAQQSGQKLNLQMSRDELVAKLREVERHGIKPVFDNQSSVQELQYEYERIKKQISMERQLKFARRMLMMCVSGLEFLNSAYDPMGLQLEGWSDQVMSSVDEYDGVLERLIEKWDEKVNVAPEVELIMTLGGSAFMFHLTASMVKNIPSMDQVAKDNPHLMQEIAKAMAKNMTSHQPAAHEQAPQPSSSSMPQGNNSTAQRGQQETPHIPKMAGPPIDILSQIMPNASSQPPMLFTQSLADTFAPPESNSNLSFDDNTTRIVEIAQDKKRDKGKGSKPDSKVKISLDDDE